MKNSLKKTGMVLAAVMAISSSALANTFYVGETGIVTDQYVTITARLRGGIVQVQFNNGAVATYNSSQVYKTSGCGYGATYPLCVNDTVIINGQGVYAEVVGITRDYQGIKYAIQTQYGTIDTGYTRAMLSLP